MDFEQWKAASGLIVNVAVVLLTPLAAWAMILMIRDLRRTERERDEEEAQVRTIRKWLDPSRN